MRNFHLIYDAICDKHADKLIEMCDDATKLVKIDDHSYSNYYRHDFVDKELSKLIFSIVQPWYPNSLLSHKWHFTKYNEDGFIKPHQDGHVSINNCRSKYTLLLYLNDDYEGGELVLDNEALVIKPKKGMIIIMDQEMWHHVKRITEGCKYLMTSDMT